MQVNGNRMQVVQTGQRLMNQTRLNGPEIRDQGRGWSVKARTVVL